jgi:hypothetical protein
MAFGHRQAVEARRHDRLDQGGAGVAAIVARDLRDHGRLVDPRPVAPRVLARAGAGPGGALVCRKDGSYILHKGFSWYRLQYDIAGTLGNRSWGYIVGPYDKDAGRVAIFAADLEDISLWVARGIHPDL